MAFGTTLFRFVAAQGGVTLGFWPALEALAAAMIVSRLAGSGAKGIATALSAKDSWVPAGADVALSTVAWVAVIPPMTGLSLGYTVGVALVMSVVSVVLTLGVHLGVRRAMRVG